MAWELLRVIFLTWSFWTFIVSGQEAGKYFKFPCFGYFCDEHKVDAIRRQLCFEQSGLKFVSLESTVSIMVVYPFLGQGSFFSHMWGLGNKGQWVVLERGQMAGLFPVSRLLSPQRLAPGCPAAWLSGRLLDGSVTPVPQRWMCICVLPFQSGKDVDTSSRFASNLRRSLILWAKFYLVGVHLFIWCERPRFFCKFSKKNVTTNQTHL